MFLNCFYAVLYVACICNVSALPLFFDSEEAVIMNDDDHLKLQCSCSESQMAEEFEPADEEVYFKTISIARCTMYNTTYVDEFNYLNIDTTDIQSLYHYFTQDKPLPKGNYTEGLKIRHLTIESQNNQDLIENNANFFDPLSNLTSLDVSGIKIPQLPMDMTVINLTLRDDAVIKDWRNCQNLERFEISRYNKKDFPIWPKSCERLTHLEIKIMLPEMAEMMAERMIAAAPRLRTLKMIHCGLFRLPIEIISNARKLVHLDLSNNKLYDELFSHFPSLENLKILDLSNNLIGGYGLGSLFPKLPVLSKLILNYDRHFHKVCGDDSQLTRDFIVPLQNSSVESIEFKDTEFHLDCFEKMHFSRLKHITMSTGTVEFKPLSLPKTNAEYLVMDLLDEDFLNVLFDEEDYETLRKENSTSSHGGKVTVLFSWIRNCECKVGWLVKALQDFPHIISMPNVRCGHADGTELLKLPKEQVECNIMTSRKDCSYKHSWIDGTVTADCGIYAWTKMEPGFPIFPINGLNVSEMGITTLRTTLPDTIRWIDLRCNLLSRATSEEAATLFAEGRRVWLADNLLLCACDNSAFIDAIQRHREQVQDYELLKCVGTNELISSVSTDVLCQVALIVSLTVIVALIVLAGLTVWLLRRYAQELRVFLYSKGWCINCLQHEDLGEKPYDAFISFAHEDQEYVEQTLLPGLEGAPEQFRVCVHYRDWLVGEWIPHQIMRSVQLSKRTLILLSKNFVQSAWSTLEFRYSLANETEDPNSKVLVLIMDDVLDTKLDMELRGYLTFNTYMRCDDPWFWEKLHYAMPHRGGKTSKSDNFDSRINNEVFNMRAIDNIAYSLGNIQASDSL